MNRRDAPARWQREWLAIGAGTVLLVFGTVLVASGDGLQVLPEDIAGRSRPGALLWLLLGFVAFLAMPRAVALISGWRVWPLVGAGALVGGVAVDWVTGRIVRPPSRMWR